MANIYNFNQSVKLTMAFDVDGTPTDPDTITLEIEKPDGTVVELAKADCFQDQPPVVGTWHYTQQGTMPGRWKWHAEGAGAATAAGDDHFTVLDKYGS